MNMPKRRLGRTGIEVTVLGLGGEGILRTFVYMRTDGYHLDLCVFCLID